MDITVVICCHQSEARIGATLKSLERQSISSAVTWEVLLVDNNCTDRTVEVAKNIWTHPVAPLIVVVETKSGLAFAKEAGFSHSRGRFVVFCDDDNWLSECYLQEVMTSLESDANIAMVGGKGSAVSTVELPDWFTHYQKLYACGEQNQGKSGYAPYLWGAGVAARRTALEEVDAQGFPKLLSGRLGASLSSGEDTEICLALRAMGWKMQYNPKMEYSHFLPEGRLTRPYLERLVFGIGSSTPVLGEYARRLDGSQTLKSRLPFSVLGALAWLRSLWCSLRLGWTRDPAVRFELQRMRGTAAGFRHAIRTVRRPSLRRRLDDFFERARRVATLRQSQSTSSRNSARSGS